jgi:hypothetical protein
VFLSVSGLFLCALVTMSWLVSAVFATLGSAWDMTDANLLRCAAAELLAVNSGISRFAPACPPVLVEWVIFRRSLVALRRVDT